MKIEDLKRCVLGRTLTRAAGSSRATPLPRLQTQQSRPLQRAEVKVKLTRAFHISPTVLFLSIPVVELARSLAGCLIVGVVAHAGEKTLSRSERSLLKN